jgi:hypothetical protein
MGIVNVSDGVTTRRVRIDDLQGEILVDCSGDDPTVVLPEGTDVEWASAADVADDPGNRGRATR